MKSTSRARSQSILKSVTSPHASDLVVPSPIETPEVKTPIRGFFQTRVIAPVIHLLRVGASPQRLAWSFAAGAVVGINPIVGSTTLVCLAIAFVFRLNLIASQIANHLCFPLQLALALAYLRAGQILFHTGPPPMAAGDLMHIMRLHPWSTAATLWTWEWHAIVVWLLAAAILTPLLAAILHPLLNRLLATLHHHDAA
jgi:uncharacterized protein (DUF2062 family)